MIIFKEFFKTQSDQNIHQNALNSTKLFQIFNFFSGSQHMPMNLLGYTCTCNDN